jgi:hypothetical protein
MRLFTFFNDPLCDENGNEFDYWVLKDRSGDEVKLDENMTLEECVKHATHYLLSNFRASPSAYEEFKMMHEDVPEPIFKDNIKKQNDSK